DALPIRLLSRLKERFPNEEVRVLDPNEEWEVPDPFLVIDTVIGVSDIHVFRSLNEFDAAPTVSMHDFDALFNLRYLAKLGKLKRLRIIGIPPGMPEEKALAGTVTAITGLFSPEDEEE
ncbi:MAG: hypothetical protein Q7S52_02150, partial [bacterium]|nr:hypothetical protein [bacterium]